MRPLDKDQVKSNVTGADGSKWDKEAGERVKPNGQNEAYKVLAPHERAKGFVRPVRTSYVHAGPSGPKYDIRPLTEEEAENFGDSFDYFEEYPEGERSRGKFWTQEQIDAVGNGCGTRTFMSQTIAETYAREPKFYGSTFCTGCRTHLPVDEFLWDDGSGERVGE